MREKKGKKESKITTARMHEMQYMACILSGRKYGFNAKKKVFWIANRSAKKGCQHVPACGFVLLVATAFLSVIATICNHFCYKRVVTNDCCQIDCY